MDIPLVPQETPVEEPQVASVIPELSPVDTSSFSLLIASASVAVLFVAVLVYLSRRKSAARGNALILAGTPDAGKTAILSRLVYGQNLPTHTSLQTNVATFESARLIDIPGHPRVRGQLNEYLPDAKAVLFVVDASTVSRNGAAVAEHLHYVMNALTSLPPSHTLPALLILAHKSDLLKSSASSVSAADTAVTRVRTVLERELERRRGAQVAVEGLGAEGERAEMGGLECVGTGTFRFSEWEGGEVRFVGTSIRGGKGGEKDEIEEVRDGLEGLRDVLGDI